MKHFFTLLVLSIVIFNAVAQKSCKTKAKTDFKHLKSSFAKEIDQAKSNLHENIKIDSLIVYSYLSETDSVFTVKMKYEYDDADNKIREYLIVPNIDEGEETTKNEYIYEGKKVIRSINYKFNKSTQEWEVFAKQETAYDGNGNVVSEISFSYEDETGNWIETTKYEYEYDAKGNETVSNLYYKIGEMEWTLAEKEENTYDANNNITQQLKYAAMPMSELSLDSKTEYTYNSKGHLLTETVYERQDEEWVPSSKDEYTYTDDAMEESSSQYDWDPYSNEWVLEEETKYVYDNEKTLLYLLITSHDSEEADVSKMFVYYHTGTITTIEEHAGAVFSVYPNPVKEYITIENNNRQIDEISIYSISGEKVSVMSKVESGRLNVSELKNGVYFISIKSGKQIKTQKIVKQ